MVSNYYVLLFTRFCFGAGEAGAFPNASIVVSRWFPPSKRASISGVLLMASQIGGAIAPLLVVPIQMRYGWRMSFLVFGVVGAIWAAAWYCWFRDTPSEMPGVSQAELQELSAIPPAAGARLSVAGGIPVRNRAGPAGHRLLLHLRLLVLPDLVSHLPGEGPRLQRNRSAAVGGRRTRSRRARISPAAPRAMPWCGGLAGPGGGGRLAWWGSAARASSPSP